MWTAGEGLALKTTEPGAGAVIVHSPLPATAFRYCRLDADNVPLAGAVWQTLELGAELTAHAGER